MANILVLDVMFSIGHKKFNRFYLEKIAKNNSLLICNDGEYYNSLASNNIRFLDFPYKKSLGPLKSRIQIFELFSFLRKQKVQKEVDCVLVLGYDTLSFPLFWFLLHPSVPVFVIQHHNIDENNNRIKRIAFNTYKNRIIHIVLDPAFCELLRVKWEVSSPIEYLPHYLSKMGLCNQQSNKQLIIALSNSNDESKIQQLISLDKSGKLCNLDLHIVVRSKTISYSSNSLSVLCGFIPEENYLRLFNDAKAILILFPDSYCIRFSCTLIEAIINYKTVISNDILFSNIYHERYPNNVLIYHSYEELLRVLSIINEIEFNADERKALVDSLSDATIDSAIDTIFGKVTNWGRIND